MKRVEEIKQKRQARFIMNRWEVFVLWELSQVGIRQSFQRIGDQWLFALYVHSHPNYEVKVSVGSTTLPNCGASLAVQWNVAFWALDDNSFIFWFVIQSLSFKGISGKTWYCAVFFFVLFLYPVYAGIGFQILLTFISS